MSKLFFLKENGEFAFVGIIHLKKDECNVCGSKFMILWEYDIGCKEEDLKECLDCGVAETVFADTF